jgi:hypothetical protein
MYSKYRQCLVQFNFLDVAAELRVRGTAVGVGTLGAVC